MSIEYNPVVFEVYNGAAGVTKWAASPFNISSVSIQSVSSTLSRLIINYTHPSSSAVYNGRAATFAFTGVGPALSGSAVNFNTAGSQFTPTYGSVIRTGAVYTVTGNPQISIIPNAEQVALDYELAIAVRADTNGSAASGATLDIRFDPAYFEVVGGASGVTQAYGSPYAITSATYSSGRLLVVLAASGGVRQQYVGDLINFNINALQLTGDGGTPVTLNSGTTFYAPVLENTTLNNANYVIFNPCPPGPQQAGVIVAQNLLPPGATRIDTFESAQEVKADPSGSYGGTNPSQNQVALPGILGGQRDMFSYNQDSTGLIRTSFLQNPRRLQHSTSARGYSIITWDGTDADPLAVNATGLGSVDLSEDDQKNSFAITVNKLDLTATFDISVYTNAGNWSKASITVGPYIGYPTPVGDGLGPKTFMVKFTDFVTQAGSGADFHNVGAIQLKIGSSSSAIDLQVGAFETRFAPALSLGIRGCNIVTASPLPYRLGYDTATGVTGITWPLPSVVSAYTVYFNGATYNSGPNTTTFGYTVVGATSQNYEITLQGDVPIGTVDTSVRGDFTYGAATIAGPDCICQSGATATPSLTPSISPTPTPATICVQVSAGLDDVEQNNDPSSGNYGTVYTNSTDIEMITDVGPQIVGLRFPALALPQGALVTNAYIQFTTDEAGSDVTNLTIRGQASDNAPAFAATANNLSVANRPRTNAQVAWAPAAWSTVGEAGANQKTPNLAPIIQEIVNRGSWASGNAAVLLIDGTGKRTAVAAETNPAQSSQLCVTFALTGGSTVPTQTPQPTSTPTVTPPSGQQTLTITVATGNDDAEETISSGNMSLSSTDLDLIDDGGSTPQAVGLRFSAIAIPRNATIRSAYIQFTSQAIDSAVCSLVIKGQAISTAPTFTTTASNITGRTTTSASVAWNPDPWTAADLNGIDQRTTEIKTIIQEIVNRADWNSGQAMGLILTGTGTRRAYAYNGSAAKAPQLVITYY